MKRCKKARRMADLLAGKFELDIKTQLKIDIALCRMLVDVDEDKAYRIVNMIIDAVLNNVKEIEGPLAEITQIENIGRDDELGVS